MAKPMRSLPAMGCPPMKYGDSPVSSTHRKVVDLTLPTSVKMQSGDRISFMAVKFLSLLETGAHKNR